MHSGLGHINEEDGIWTSSQRLTLPEKHLTSNNWGLSNMQIKGKGQFWFSVS